MNDPIRILVKGMNWSGSGAVVDFLKEYKGVVQVPGGLPVNDPTGEARLGEFNYFRLFGGVGDQIDVTGSVPHPSILKKEVRDIQEMISLKGRLKVLLKALYHGDALNFKGNSSILRQLKCIGDELQVLIDAFAKDENPAYRLNMAREWIVKIVASLEKSDSKAFLFDQAINIGQHDRFWPEVFSPYKLILVIRNPRDQFSQMANHRGYFSRHYRTAIAYLREGWSFEDAVRFRVDSKQREMEVIEEFLEQAKDTMVISFEEMVLDYNRAKTKIQNFLGFAAEEHARPLRFFNPAASRKNIGVYKTNTITVDDNMLTGLIDWYDRHSGFKSAAELDSIV